MVKLIKTKICSKRSCSQKYWIVKLIKKKVVLRDTEILN